MNLSCIYPTEGILALVGILIVGFIIYWFSPVAE